MATAAAAAAAAATRFKLIFFVPQAALSACKAAVFAAGAGCSPGAGKHYSEWCWTTSGTGQFRPGHGANPHLGRVGELEEVQELRVETLCMGRDVVTRAVEKLKAAHPYEEPAYEVYKLEDF